MDSNRRHAVVASLEIAFGANGAYSPDVVWRAPRRGVVWHGRDEVTRRLRLESAAMQALRVTEVRRTSTATRVIHEFSARFIYAGFGIEHLDLPRGTDVELTRLRILTRADDLVVEETCIENWTVLSG